ncbi:MAG: disulfide bond formation protein B [Rhodobacteraceae bacterium]|nr:disulfide bond formation protein B [Paracoccaceae bacterium]
MTRIQLIGLAAGGSLAVLLAALAFQYIGGLAPCPLCVWQRWPHFAAVVIGGLALTVRAPGLVRAWPVLGAIAALGAAGLAGYHFGVEMKWWIGTPSCMGGSISGVSVTDLLNPDVSVAPPVRCDEVAWSFLGLSMAGWNVLASLGFAGLWAWAAARD